MEWHPEGMHSLSRMHREDRTSLSKWRSAYRIYKSIWRKNPMMRPKAFLCFTAGWRSAILRSFKSYMRQPSKPKERGQRSPLLPLPHHKKLKKMSLHLPRGLQVANNRRRNKKRNDGEDEYALHLATFIEMKAEEHKKREERWKAEKGLEERRFLWDQEQKIMFCKTPDMDESQREYIKAMRQQIARSKEASVRGSTSEQGSGGDAEGADFSSVNSDFHL